ncbi:tRNA-dependent cyclodipeptide synthase [Saccharopolyspora sp. NPDC002686]|uniref:tRNA-dependent cyclodipeptide synthase n=1 Tax=Saccharopolyspora sp. NPDC002686 TaxID=3154541 RepID=UPI00332E30EA
MKTNLQTGPVHGFEVEPISARCREIWERGEHVLIGVSTGNSYFSQERLTSLARWAGHFFDRIDVMYVDTCIEGTLISSGLTAHEASRLVKSRLRDMRRKLRRVVESLGSTADRVRVRPLSEFLQEDAYRAVRRRAEEELARNPQFASVCEDMVRRYLAGKCADGRCTPEGVRAGMDYLLAELPFFLDSPNLFDVRSSSACYHVSTPLVEYLVQANSDVLPASRSHGYLVVKPAEAQ